MIRSKSSTSTASPDLLSWGCGKQELLRVRDLATMRDGRILQLAVRRFDDMNHVAVRQGWRRRI